MSRISAGVLLAGTMFAGSMLASAPVSAETVTLRMANWVPPVHHFSNTARAWLDTVEAAAGGDLKVEIDKSALAKPPGQYDLVKNGIRNIAWSVANYTPGRFDLFQMAEVPFATANAETGSEALWKWYAKHNFEKVEFTDTKLLVAFVHGPGVLHSRTEVTAINQLSGQKVRVPGSMVEFMKAIGSTPVFMPATSVNEGLNRGTLDAVTFPWEAVKGFSLTKLATYHLEIPGGFYTTAFMINMNQKTFDGLSKKHRDAFLTAGGAAGSKLVGKHWDMADKAGKAAAVANGNKIQTISKAEFANLSKGTEAVRQNLIEKANKKGFDGEALMKELVSMMQGSM